MSKTKTQEEFIREVYNKNPNINVIGNYINAKTRIACQCKICNHIWYPTSEAVKGCPACSGRVPIIGISDLCTTNPLEASQLKDKNLGYSLLAGSSKEVIFICPYCNTEIKSRVNRWINGETKCKKCNDNISYPEKFIFNLLHKLLNDAFNYQVIFNWAKNKKYDFSFYNNSCIIETHGMQHYEDCLFNKLSNNSLEKEQENDRLKEQLAKKNGIKHYIVLDCRKSELMWIRKSVMESELPSIFNFTEDDIDWNEIHQKSLKSIVIDCCKLWENKYSVVEISKKLKLAKGTIVKYLKSGSQVGICSYDAAFEINKNNQRSARKIICMNDNQIFNTVSEASKLFNIPIGAICSCCKGKQKYTTYKNTGEQLRWMYYEDYVKGGVAYE